MMKFLFRSCLVILVLAAIMPDALAQVSKEEKKFWKKKAKMYVDNPLALKAEFENYQDQIKDLKERHKELLNSSGRGNTQLTDSLRWAAIQAEGDLKALQSNYDQLKEQYRSLRLVSNQGIQPGLVFRVQIGAYVFREPGEVKGDATDILTEKADGFNKYVIGNFRSYEDCEMFRDEIRALGISDAWVVPYLEGERITIQEAKDHLESQGQAVFKNN